MTNTDAFQLRSHRFFPGEQLTARVLNQSADAERHRRWLHNRLLHGYGISFGLQVVRGAGDTSVVVGPGHAIDADGRDLVVDQERTVQVPPVPSGAFDLICEWSDSARESSTSSCDATGETVRYEAPVISFIHKSNSAGRGVALATATVTDCELAGLMFDARRPLNGPPVPYVDGGRYVPRPGDWTELKPSATAVAGVRITVDTSSANFFGNVSYNARVMGKRWMEGWKYVLCLDPFIIESGPKSFEMGVVILADDVSAAPFTPVSLTKFTQDPSVNTPTKDIPQKLNWAVAWMGVEGTQ